MQALVVERTCGVVAVALSQGNRQGVRLVSGEHRGFGLSNSRAVVHVPYPGRSHWGMRELTCGVALQCSPSKDRLALHDIEPLSPRELAALTVVEGQVALGWVSQTWPGLMPNLERLLPELGTLDAELDAATILERALHLARSGDPVAAHPLLGRPTPAGDHPRGVAAQLRRMYGRVPWSTRQRASKRASSIPVGGEGGVINPSLPPPLRPEDDDFEVRPDERIGVPYPEWDVTRGAFRPDHVAVLERPREARVSPRATVPPDVRRWFAEHTYRSMRGGLEDGSELDIDRYVEHHINVQCGEVAQPRLFRELLPCARDVCTALLLDASSSLGVRSGQVFGLELACADALSQAMNQTRERHGIFMFSGNSRHRVEVTCLKDFEDRHLVAPSAQDLTHGGYTRLGAPVRHLTSRLMAQHSQRRLLMVIGDGLVSDEGYEGRYAWADVAHAVEEAEEAGVTPYYIGVGHSRVDPLTEMFGPRRSTRIAHVHDLPRVLVAVHRHLVAA